MSVLSNVELCFWNLESVGAPTLSSVRDALSAHGLNPARATDVPETTAFRRAGAALAEKDQLARYFPRKADSRLCVQIDSERENGDGRLHRSLRSLYSLWESGPRHDGGEPLAYDDAYAHALRTYTGGDVSKTIQAVLTLDGLGAYSPRKGGAVYFVPQSPTAPVLLSQIEAFSASVGVRFLRYQVPDLAAQRDEIAAAVAASLTADLDAHQAAISAYTPDTAQRHLAARHDALAASANLLLQLGDLIPAQRGAILQRIVQLTAALRNAGESIDAAKHAASIAGPTRRILFSEEV